MYRRSASACQVCSSLIDHLISGAVNMLWHATLLTYLRMDMMNVWKVVGFIKAKLPSSSFPLGTIPLGWIHVESRWIMRRVSVRWNYEHSEYSETRWRSALAVSMQRSVFSVCSFISSIHLVVHKFTTGLSRCSFSGRKWLKGDMLNWYEPTIKTRCAVTNVDKLVCLNNWLELDS